MADLDTTVQGLIDDIIQTPGVRRGAQRKDHLFFEGSMPLTELKRGNLNKAVVSALNRMRRKAHLPRLPFEQWVVEWCALREDVLEYRIYAIGLPSRSDGDRCVSFALPQHYPDIVPSE
jgi:hypothetical protein